MGPDVGGSPVGDVAVFAFGGAKVVPVEAVVLEHFAVAQHYFCASGFVYVKLHPAGHVLAEVQHGFPFLGVEHRGGEAGLFHDLGTHPGGELFKVLCAGTHTVGGSLTSRAGPTGDFLAGVVMFSVIDVAEGDGGGIALPGVVGNYHLLRAVFHGHVDLADGLHGVAVQIMVPVKDDVSFVPARSHGKSQGVFSLTQQGGDIEGLVFQLEVVAVIPGQQVFVPGLFPVDLQFVNAHAADVSSSGLHFPAQGEVLGKQGLDFLFLKVGGNPLGLPGLPLLGCLKPGGGGGTVPAVAPNGDGPMVPGAGKKLHWRLEAQGGNVLPLAALIDDLSLGSLHQDLSSGLAFVSGVLCHPGKDRMIHEKAQRCFYVVGAKMGKSQNDSSLTTSLIQFGRPANRRAADPSP
ncbi:unknown [Clostridium sp. CAG:1013]|nr:unknown [Clostridium sp. CAG:1013]